MIQYSEHHILSVFSFDKPKGHQHFCGKTFGCLPVGFSWVHYHLNSVFAGAFGSLQASV